MFNDITLIFRPILNGIGPSGTHGSRDFRISYYQTVMLSCGCFIHNSVTWMPFTTMKNTEGFFTHIKVWFKTFKASTPKITWKSAPEVIGLLQRKWRKHLAKVQTRSQQPITYVNYVILWRGVQGRALRSHVISESVRCTRLTTPWKNVLRQASFSLTWLSSLVFMQG